MNLEVHVAFLFSHNDKCYKTNGNLSKSSGDFHCHVKECVLRSMNLEVRVAFLFSLRSSELSVLPCKT
jgi:hypothetical protein